MEVHEIVTVQVGMQGVHEKLRPALNKRKTLFTSKLDLQLRKKLVKYIA
jgi:hypothetical protein